MLVKFKTFKLGHVGRQDDRRFFNRNLPLADNRIPAIDDRFREKDIRELSGLKSRKRLDPRANHLGRSQSFFPGFLNVHRWAMLPKDTERDKKKTPGILDFKACTNADVTFPRAFQKKQAEEHIGEAGMANQIHNCFLMLAWKRFHKSFFCFPLPRKH
ncbi:MAG: hypothetical protein BWY42_01427 [Candidatus Omnitrophica bacterium ADurb.Bin277]|nr:MAG: hypothetical protein BWY42_01427 [Candidatus Omnitrophica bacterium ADurb.Bin277]